MHRALLCLCRSLRLKAENRRGFSAGSSEPFPQRRDEFKKSRRSRKLLFSRRQLQIFSLSFSFAFKCSLTWELSSRNFAFLYKHFPTIKTNYPTKLSGSLKFRRLTLPQRHCSFPNYRFVISITNEVLQPKNASCMH